MADIPGINIPAPVVPFTTEDTYATHDEQYGKGGFRSVETLADMNAIPSDRRSAYMRVKVYADPVEANNGVYELVNNVFTKATDGAVNFVIEW